MPSGRSISTGGEFFAVVSAYWMRKRSSRRAPRSEIEPLSAGVWIGTRGLAARAAARVTAGGAFSAGAPGAAA